MIKPSQAAGPDTVKILISAAEASSDAHGAQLLAALREAHPEVQAYGIGGPKLQAEGLESLVDARELMVMGFSEILGRLPRIRAALDRLVESVATHKPDIAVVIDYPDFHFRLAKRLKRLGVPVIYYIPPKVWVWRQKRVKRLREGFAKILCIFPFEKSFFEKHSVMASFVGNPLLDELPLSMSREDARCKLGLLERQKVVSLLPGSRPSELKHHLELMLESAVRVAAQMRYEKRLAPRERLVALIPLAETSQLAPIQERIQKWLGWNGWTGTPEKENSAILDIRLSRGDSATCLVAADAALVKSGTSTLEAGLLNCPHVLAYRTGWLTAWIYKLLIRYSGPVGLVNLVAQERIVPEILLFEATPRKLAEQLYPVFTDPVKRAHMRERFAHLRAKLQPNHETLRPRELAAREVWNVVQSTRNVPPPG